MTREPASRDGADASRRTAARIAGFCYLYAMASAVFAEVFVRGWLIVDGDAVRTAQNIVAHRTLFRLGIVTELFTFVSDVTLVAALVVILAPVHRPLAIYAAFMRLVAVSVGVSMTAGSFDVLRILGGAADLRAFDDAQLAALARLSLGAHGAAYNVAFVFLGIGSAAFAYLWCRTRYVPRGMAVLGIFASLLLAAGTLATFLAPGLRELFHPSTRVPMFLFEVGMGVLLLLGGLRAPPEQRAAAL